MEAKFTGAVLVAILTFSSTTAIKAEAQKYPTSFDSKTILIAERPLSTTFRCVRNGDGFATIAKRGDRTTPPVITWNSRLGKYTPHKRCNIVSQKLTQTVLQNGGKLRNLQLMAGPVKEQVVICVINNMQSACNNDNMLFTLGSDNAKNPEAVLARMSNFSIVGSGAPVQENSSGQPLPLEVLNRFLEPENENNSAIALPKANNPSQRDNSI